MVNWTCAFSQSESGKYLEWIIIEIKGSHLDFWASMQLRCSVNKDVILNAASYVSSDPAWNMDSLPGFVQERLDGGEMRWIDHFPWIVSHEDRDNVMIFILR